MSERDRPAAAGVEQTADASTHKYWAGVLRVAMRETLAFSRAQLLTGALIVVLVFLLSRAEDFTTEVLDPLIVVAALFLVMLVWNVILTPAAAARGHAAERDAAEAAMAEAATSKVAALEDDLETLGAKLEPRRPKDRLTEQLRKGEKIRLPLPWPPDDDPDAAAERLEQSAQQVRDWQSETERVLDEEARQHRPEFKATTSLLLVFPALVPDTEPPTWREVSDYRSELLAALREIIKQL